MAHFAQVSSNGEVVRVLVVADAVLAGPDSTNQEQQGIDFLRQLYGPETSWVQTSYSGRVRGNFARPGYIWDAGRDAFIPPAPFPSWTLNQVSWQWEPPTPRPEGNPFVNWDESSQSWRLPEIPDGMELPPSEADA
jgi:hypothetical protein